jgi:hypothetical protein
VPLSEDKQGRLREIEDLTAAADPAFARRLDLPAAARRGLGRTVDRGNYLPAKTATERPTRWLTTIQHR